ncbi:multidrug ABC transporter permease [Bifidobacterium hapali]|uniref:Multidrug ABC transporter permease n=1 Tax=Bifidobacterium hapali TaxID=1630172 RepID=A0A261FZE2_9BIFI|nr:ABC transporter permease [Bifidobacterium hapali]OZG64293.1 multidrug ABC transporter permease [Bifidobacterium hapali]
MWSTFIMTMKTNLRNKASLFWLIVFPLVLATLFTGMFSNLAKGYDVQAMPLAIVENNNWKQAAGASALIDALSDKSAQPTQSQSGQSQPEQTNNHIATLINATTVDSIDQARKALADGTVDGYVLVDKDGLLELTLASGVAGSAGDTMSSGSAKAITIAALGGAIDLYNRTDVMTRKLLEQNSQAATSRAFWSSLSDVTGMTREVQLTNFKPEAMARYYYAMLGMACLMAMGYSISAVTTAQANLSALGLRRSIAPLNRVTQLMAGFLASWLCSGVSLLIALAYVRYVCGIEIGGREPAAVLAVAVASFMACAFGTMIGAIPKLPQGVKMGLTSAIPCALSLFSGLYGGFAMSLSNWITRNVPIFALLNPAQQVTNLFYGLLYYDSYRPFLNTCGVLLTMSAIFLVVSVIMLKEQRYEHL